MATSRPLRHKRLRRKSSAGSLDFLAAVGDVMAGLVFIFILYALALSLQAKDAEKKAQDAEASAKQKTAELVNAREKATKQKERFGAIIAEYEKGPGAILQALLSDSKLSAAYEIDEELGVLRLPEAQVLFPSGSHKYEPVAEQHIQILSQLLATRLPCFAAAPEPPNPQLCSKINPQRLSLEAVFVEGHTDHLPLGDNWKKAKLKELRTIDWREEPVNFFNNNLELSTARAHYTYSKMKALSKPADNKEAKSILEQLINQRGEKIFGVSGYGAERPIKRAKHLEKVSTNLSAEQALAAGRKLRSANRRIELRFIVAPSTKELSNP